MNILTNHDENGQITDYTHSGFAEGPEEPIEISTMELFVPAFIDFLNEEQDLL